jgi:hypothetical protein
VSERNRHQHLAEDDSASLVDERRDIKIQGDRVLIYNDINNVPLRSRFATRSNHVSMRVPGRLALLTLRPMVALRCPLFS